MAFFKMVVIFAGLIAAQDIGIERCQSLCKPSRPVCGTDNITYTSRCHLRCNSQTSLKHRGRCRPPQLPCQTALAYAEEHKQRGAGSYLPSCRPDGSFSPVQCHSDTGYCWCVDPQGRPIPRSSVRNTSNGRPKCNVHAKSATNRRSSTRNRKPKRGCKRADKALFNNNLINIFQTEWLRKHTNSNLQGTELDNAVLDWKFKDMDTDKNGILDKTEYRDLRKLVKKVVKPKRCSKTFAKACDVDRDQQISRDEWSDCLTRDGMDVSLRVFLSLNAEDRTAGGDRHSQHHKEDSREDEDEDYEDNDDDDDFIHHQPPKPSPHQVLSVTSSDQNDGEDSSERRDEDATDCLSDRQTILSEQSMNNMYVPECTPDGRYKKIQCYKSVGYCWCVHEDTGKNIPGTSVQNGTPNCDQMPAPSRPMKGCPEPKKTAFLKDLIDFLHNRMIQGTNDTNITGESGSWQATREEKAATWNFVVLDKNKNKVLERKEWKAFRALVSATKQLKRCGKKLPRYCDVNHDRKISMTEWLDCLNTKRIIQENISTTPVTHSRRKGKNPLETYLNSDD